MIIYLAGPISGQTYDNVVDRLAAREKVLKGLGFTVIHPMTGKEALRTGTNLRAHSYKIPVSTNHAIFRRDKWMVSMCDIILAELTDAEIVSIGTCFELAWASHLGKHTIVILPKGNIHRHAFVLEAADVIFEEYEDAMVYLQKLSMNKEI